MTVTINGTTGVTTPGVTNSGNETIAGTLQVGGVTTNVYPLVSGTSVASTSGTSIDFTSIPSWVKRITVMFKSVSTNGTSQTVVRLGTSGGITSSGYTAANWGASAGGLLGWGATTSGFAVNQLGVPLAADSYHGTFVLNLQDSSTNTWVCSSSINNSAGAGYSGAGLVALSGVATTVRITTVNGTDTFDAGSINILYE